MHAPRLAALLVSCFFVLLAEDLPVYYGAAAGATSKAALDQRLKAPFAEGMAHPPGIANCVGLLAHRRAAQTQPLRFTADECLALQQLSKATPARRSFLHDLPWDEHVLPLLPPQLAITVSNESEKKAGVAARNGRSWSDVDPSATASKRSADEIVVTGDSFRQVLVLWGRGDFDGAGTEELLVQSLDTLTEGTYRNTRLFILIRRTPAGPLSVVRRLI